MARPTAPSSSCGHDASKHEGNIEGLVDARHAFAVGPPIGWWPPCFLELQRRALLFQNGIAPLVELGDALSRLAEEQSAKKDLGRVHVAFTRLKPALGLSFGLLDIDRDCTAHARRAW